MAQSELQRALKSKKSTEKNIAHDLNVWSHLLLLPSLLQRPSRCRKEQSQNNPLCVLDKHCPWQWTQRDSVTKKRDLTCPHGLRSVHCRRTGHLSRNLKETFMIELSKFHKVAMDGSTGVVMCYYRGWCRDCMGLEKAFQNTWPSCRNGHHFTVQHLRFSG